MSPTCCDVPENKTALSGTSCSKSLELKVQKWICGFFISVQARLGCSAFEDEDRRRFTTAAVLQPIRAQRFSGRTAGTARSGVTDGVKLMEVTASHAL